MLKVHILALTLLGSAAFSEVCPTAPPIQADEDRLFDQLRVSSSARAAELNGQLWMLWLQAPDAVAQTLLDEALEAIRLGDFGHAARLLDRLIAYCPNFAEGHNQRAFVHYLQREYAQALLLLDVALRLNPRHLGALTGKALTFIALDDLQAAQDPLKHALRLNPWLNERSLLVEPLQEDI